MKPIKAVPAILFLSFFCMFGCKKSSTHIKTNTELITQTSWKFGTAKVSGVDVSSSVDPCERDNIYVFASAGTGTADEGATKCDPADPQTSSFAWNFATGETILHISTVLFTGGSNDFTIVTLNDTQLVLSQDITISGTTQTAVVTFVH